jgi:hypothetical protein
VIALAVLAVVATGVAATGCLQPLGAGGGQADVAQFASDHQVDTSPASDHARMLLFQVLAQRSEYSAGFYPATDFWGG